ncbi:MAG TPA: TlpA disulfide reductase family protein [Desulfopila sp.]|nr:TlpA disulfide reductase family protein [Desulfopila sp.]
MSQRFSLSICFTVIATVMFLATARPAATETLPEISLAVPESTEERAYLGLEKKPGETFSLAEVDADILLIELFSMYCPYCQAEAPRINVLYDLALRQEEHDVDIRLVGLGASNTQFEVDHFRDTYDIAFPLFPDKSMTFYKKLGGEGTPGFLGVLLKEGQDPEIVLRQSGGFDSPEEFLEKLLESAGYK